MAAEGLAPARHHLRLLTELGALAEGATRRLIVLMPPGAAKSTYASVLFPPFFLARHPGSDVIAACHTDALSRHFARRARALLRAHGAALGLRLAGDAKAAAQWEVETTDPDAPARRGSYFAAGVRGPIVGRRADLVLIDDPVKSRAEAESPALRASLWEWFRADLLPRLKPGGRVALVMTRWHEDDLAGRLLARQAGEWTCLSLPALAGAEDALGRAEGEALWPEWEDRAALLARRAALGPRAFAALYQQDPRPDEGALFPPARIPVLERAPEMACGRVVRAWDLAATAPRPGADPDWTVGLKLLRDAEGRFVVLDVLRLRGSPLEVEMAIAATARADGDILHSFPRDPGQASAFQQAHFARLLAGARFTFTPERQSKSLRAGPVAAQAEAGNLALLRGPWNAALLDELAHFPHGAHDDQVDALARAFAELTLRPPGGAAPPEPGWMGR